MRGKSVDFGDKNIKKKKTFLQKHKLFQIDKIDANKILSPKIESYGTKKSFKYFIGYSDNDAIRPL